MELTSLAETPGFWILLGILLIIGGFFDWKWLISASEIQRKRAPLIHNDKSDKIFAVIGGIILILIGIGLKI